MRRSLILFGSFALVLVGIGAWIFWNQVRPQTPPADVPPPAPDAGPAPGPTADAGTPAPESRVDVLQVQGPVDVHPRDQDWQPVQPGSRLSAEDTIRTGPGGSARLQIDKRSIINLQDRSELAVRVISDTVQVFGLIHGTIKVDYSPEGERVLRIESEESGAVAETHAGRFTALSARGTFAVAATAGEVKLTAQKTTVPIGPGQMSTVHKDQAPGPAGPIPAAILLKVALPGSRVQRESHIMVRGRTSPGARVEVNGIDTQTDTRGRFRIRVALHEGTNPLVVQCQDVAGNTERREFGPIIVDPSAPIETLDIQWGQKDPAP